MAKINNVLIRNLSDHDREAIEIAKQETGQPTASKALLAVCKSYARIIGQLKKKNEEILSLKKRNAELEDLFLSLRKNIDTLTLEEKA
jgi:hypothetical protein